MTKNKIIWLAVSCLMVIALLVTSCGGATTDDVNGNGDGDGDGDGVVDGGDGDGGDDGTIPEGLSVTAE